MDDSPRPLERGAIPGEAPARLQDDPDLLYLLRAYETLYRHGSAGGSTAIRGHRRRVRDRLSGVLGANPALEARAVRSRLTWGYGYGRMPRTLARGYAYCEVLGPRGPVPCEGLILGAVLFAPETTYPQHGHHEIEKIYVPVAGAWSENDAAIYAPGSLILNGSGEEHRITTGPVDPCLLAYA